MVRAVLDPVGDGVHLALLQLDLHPQRRLALVQLTVLHVLEKGNEDKSKKQ